MDADERGEDVDDGGLVHGRVVHDALQGVDRAETYVNLLCAGLAELFWGLIDRVMSAAMTVCAIELACGMPGAPDEQAIIDARDADGEVRAEVPPATERHHHRRH
ncbi:hypothetical protein DKT68_13350 [Micromonospora acroterricola]|uniref:Uncharacterized protein n=1 Tax=Micromonospora acroterricola TaxID=2202421 RepID=A0A317D8L8_9ACTN|nr:hypothetical protein [Micromonospora acroterricola]PWR08975.1 hypothetical protein DKT68_13350 [Micromonospora acroterricola]